MPQVAPVAAPLILTLALPRAAFARLDALRSTHMPAGHLHVPAHLTLFRHLPGPQAPAIVEMLRSECRAEAPFDVRLAGPTAMGGTVAIRVDSTRLLDLRARLAEHFAPLLIPQDQSDFRAHVTIANHLAPAAARQLAAMLGRGFRPERVTATGLILAAIHGKRWSELVRLGFRPY
jgi:2'-5' RNA ligase